MRNVLVCFVVLCLNFSNVMANGHICSGGDGSGGGKAFAVEESQFLGLGGGGNGPVSRGDNSGGGKSSVGGDATGGGFPARILKMKMS